MKKVFIGLFAISLFVLTGCGNTEQKGDSIKLEKGKFSITCFTDEIKEENMKRKIETTYNFNEQQYVINYNVITTQKFDDNAVYKTYKEAQEETVKNSTKDILYNLKVNNSAKTLIFTMAITNINLNDTDEKEKLKARVILNNIENATDAKYTCKINGIEKSELK